MGITPGGMVMNWTSFAIGAVVFGGLGAVSIYALIRWFISNTTGWK